MGEAGDQWPAGIPSVGTADNGNDWTLTITYEYLVEDTGGILE